MFQPFTLNIKGELRVYDRPQVMGIVNVTPDSFFAGSRNRCLKDITIRVERMIDEGVDFFDVGGYSSRPGASTVTIEEELHRVETGLEAIRAVTADIPVSVDTFRSEVARASVVEWGADMVNDISGGDLDPLMSETIASLRVPYIMMHMRGTPETMQELTEYENVTARVIQSLSEKLRRLRLHGVSDIIVDPGFGFSKTTEQNFELMRNLRIFKEAFAEPTLVGISRKSMITKPLGLEPEEALNGTTVLNTLALVAGASFLRVHDVKEAVEAVKLFTLSTD